MEVQRIELQYRGRPGLSRQVFRYSVQVYLHPGSKFWILGEPKIKQANIVRSFMVQIHGKVHVVPSFSLYMKRAQYIALGSFLSTVDGILSHIFKDMLHKILLSDDRYELLHVPTTNSYADFRSRLDKY